MMTSSYLYFLLFTHRPSTSGVLLTFFNGPGPPHLTSPTTVFRLVALIASRSEAGFPGSVVRLSESTATSNSACEKPIGCVHCLLVADSYESASCFALCLVSEEAKGCDGDHHTSVLKPSPRSPSASIAGGKSSALPSVTT